VPNVLVINPAINAKNVSELVALAKAQPGKFSFGSNGNGTAQHLIGAQFESMGGVELLHVPYKGSGPLTTDLLGGQIQMSFDTITPVLPHIKAGKLRALAVTTGKRSSALPDVPTLDEAGLKGFVGTCRHAQSRHRPYQFGGDAHHGQTRFSKKIRRHWRQSSWQYTSADGATN
jgi:tripartite-type tricarboxylate transporter receptor subunit TctC